MPEWWNAPCCERCWLERNPVTEMCDDDGNVVEASVRPPTRLTEPCIEVCGFCDEYTIFGAYVRASTTEAPFGGLGED